MAKKPMNKPFPKKPAGKGDKGKKCKECGKANCDC